MRLGLCDSSDIPRSLGAAIATLGIVSAIIGAAPSCHGPTAPAVPLTLSDTAVSVDGKLLPAPLPDASSTITYLVQFTLDLTADGLWASEGWRYPQGGSRVDVSEFRDNGYYTFDGRTLVLHSNFTHAEWPASLNGDTISVSAALPFSRARHLIALTP